jgi:hypothetical protein
MPATLSGEVAELLADTRRLLDCAEPNLTDWEDYSRRRNELFQRLQDRSPAIEGIDLDFSALLQLYAAVLENDRLLVLKIRQHLSEISRELEALSDQRRLVNAYDSVNNPHRSFHRHSA